MQISTKNKNILVEQEFIKHLLSCVEDMHILLTYMEQHTGSFQYLKSEGRKLQTQGKLLDCCDILVRICADI